MYVCACVCVCEYILTTEMTNFERGRRLKIEVSFIQLLQDRGYYGFCDTTNKSDVYFKRLTAIRPPAIITMHLMSTRKQL